MAGNESQREAHTSKESCCSTKQGTAMVPGLCTVVVGSAACCVWNEARGAPEGRGSGRFKFERQQNTSTPDAEASTQGKQLRAANTAC